MTSEAAGAVRALLVEAEVAHGTYESTVLNGVYDEEWPRWYAAYVVDHGLAPLLGREVAADDLAAFLATTFAEFKADAGVTAAEPWADYTARRIVEEL